MREYLIVAFGQNNHPIYVMATVYHAVTIGARQRRLEMVQTNFKNIERERHRMNFTKLEFARKLGVDRSTLNNWYAQKNPMQVDKLIKCCDLFNCSADYLLGRTDARSGFTNGNETVTEKVSA